MRSRERPWRGVVGGRRLEGRREEAGAASAELGGIRTGSDYAIVASGTSPSAHSPHSSLN